MNLSITNLNVWTGDMYILRNITLEVPGNQHISIIGFSGSGKSILSLTIMGLLLEGTHAGGSIRWDGRELVEASERELRSLCSSQISMMFQDPAASLGPLMRLGKQIALPLHRHRDPRGAALCETIKRILAKVTLPGPMRIARFFPYKVPDGQRQRVTLTMTLATSSSLFIADRPATTLDAAVQRTVLDLPNKVTHERDVSLLLISHDLPVAARMISRIIIVDTGCITNGMPVEVFHTISGIPSDSARSIASTMHALGSVFEHIGAVCPGSQPGHAPGEAGERKGEPASSTDNGEDVHE